jgi:8-oxo-dGTP pyrophosphatase MutT (NUDIX family)
VNFGCRTAGVLVHQNHILLQGEPQGTFWTLPGGGIELLENSHAALKREMQEELDIDISIERLLWVVENFFVSASDGKAHHEIGWYYLISPYRAPHLYHLEQTFSAKEKESKTDIIFQWFKLSDLQNVLFHPQCLKEELKALPVTPKHILNDEISIALL